MTKQKSGKQLAALVMKIVLIIPVALYALLSLAVYIEGRPVIGGGVHRDISYLIVCIVLLLICVFIIPMIVNAIFGFGNSRKHLGSIGSGLKTGSNAVVRGAVNNRKQAVSKRTTTAMTNKQSTLDASNTDSVNIDDLVYRTIIGETNLGKYEKSYTSTKVPAWEAVHAYETLVNHFNSAYDEAVADSRRSTFDELFDTATGSSGGVNVELHKDSFDVDCDLISLRDISKRDRTEVTDIDFLLREGALDYYINDRLIKH